MVYVFYVFSMVYDVTVFVQTFFVMNSFGIADVMFCFIGTPLVGILKIDGLYIVFVAKRTVFTDFGKRRKSLLLIFCYITLSFQIERIFHAKVTSIHLEHCLSLILTV